MLAFATTGSFAGRTLPFRTSVQPLQVRPTFKAARRVIARAVLTQSAIANKSFQLEEDEDSFSCASAVYLNEDGTLTFGRTDGPRPDSVNATWSYSDRDGELLLEIERFFGADATPFAVKRILKGHLDDSRKNLEGLPVFAGGMYIPPADFSPHSEVGWFAMILATDDLPDDSFDISSSQ